MNEPLNQILTPILTPMAALEADLRTEQYFCPIKHARKILGTHSHYNRFLAYGEAENYEAKLEAYRVALGKIK